MSEQVVNASSPPGQIYSNPFAYFDLSRGGPGMGGPGIGVVELQVEASRVAAATVAAEKAFVRRAYEDGRDLASTTFHEFVLKIHGGCNLACDYCYMYELADQSWRDAMLARMPVYMVKQIFDRVVEYDMTLRFDYGIEPDPYEFILHGGEPLLAEKEEPGYLDAVGALARMAFGNQARLNMQTNATLLNPKILDILRENDIRLGISIDGAQQAHDRHRVNKGGRGSFAQVEKAVELLNRPGYKHLFGGLLCVVDPSTDPIETYEALCSFEPRSIDFLLPQRTWADLPNGLQADNTPYADWLIKIFDRWLSDWDDPNRPHIPIRHFGELIKGILGTTSSLDYYGLGPKRNLFFTPEGQMMATDSLKSTYQGADWTPLNVWHDKIMQAWYEPMIRQRQMGQAALSQQCQRCSIVDVCGGQSMSTRFDKNASGVHTLAEFDNPSVYCYDVAKLVRHIGWRVLTYGNNMQHLVANPAGNTGW